MTSLLSGRLTAALINLVHITANLLQTYQYVHLVALDFSKVFDTVRHSTLMAKFSNLHIPDCIYNNWITNFLLNRDLCTKFNGNLSAKARINASIVQGTTTGPGSYNVNASDLRPCYPENRLNKYADDSYLNVQSINSHLVREELDHIEEWAGENNLSLNASESKEMIIRRLQFNQAALPQPIPGIERVDSINILGVILRCDLSFHEQVDRLVSQSAQTMYALRMLRSQGLSGPNLWEVAEATLVSRLSYASQVWWDMIRESERLQLRAVLGRAIKQGFLPPQHPSFLDICDNADHKLFQSCCTTLILFYISFCHPLKLKILNSVKEPTIKKFQKILIRFSRKLSWWQWFIWTHIKHQYYDLIFVCIEFTLTLLCCNCMFLLILIWLILLCCICIVNRVRLSCVVIMNYLLTLLNFQCMLQFACINVIYWSDFLFNVFWLYLLYCVSIHNACINFNSTRYSEIIYFDAIKFFH